MSSELSETLELEDEREPLESKGGDSLVHANSEDDDFFLPSSFFDVTLTTSVGLLDGSASTDWGDGDRFAELGSRRVFTFNRVEGISRGGPLECRVFGTGFLTILPGCVPIPLGLYPSGLNVLVDG